MIKEFDLYIYPRVLWVAVDASNKEFEQFGFDIDKTNILEGYADTQEVYSETYDKAGILIRFEDRYMLTLPIITHEAIHAANYIYDIIGASYDLNNDEPYAYLCEYIAKCCESMK